MYELTALHPKAFHDKGFAVYKMYVCVYIYGMYIYMYMYMYIWVVVKIMVPFWGTLNNGCRIIIGTQKRTIILTTAHMHERICT